MDRTPIDGPLIVHQSWIVGDKPTDTLNTLYVLGLKQIMPYMREMGYKRYRPGFLGENILVKSLSEKEIREGDRFAIGDVIAVASGPRTPCYKLNVRFNDPKAANKMKTHRCGGVMFEIEKPGKVYADSIFERIELAPEGSEPIMRPPRRQR